MLQNCLYIFSREVYPIDLGLFFSVILIMLFLAWLIKDHVAGRYDFLLPVEKEVGLSGGHIQQLIV